jgi:hypothetical protein
MENLSHQSDDDNGDDGRPNEDEFYMDEANYQFDDSDEERQREADNNVDYGNFYNDAFNYQSEDEDDVDNGIGVNEDYGYPDDGILCDNELNRGSARDGITTPKQLLITDYMLWDPNYKSRSETMGSSSEETRAHTSKGNSRSNRFNAQKTSKEKPAHGIPLTKKHNKRLRKASKQVEQQQSQQQLSQESKNAKRKTKRSRRRLARTKAKRLYNLNNNHAAPSVTITHDLSQLSHLSCLSNLSHLSCLTNLNCLSSASFDSNTLSQLAHLSNLSYLSNLSHLVHLPCLQSSGIS